MTRTNFKNNELSIAIIPARSGSKRLIDKNIKFLNGKPLIAYTIQAALESKCFDRVIVSTDSVRYKEIAEKFGAEVPFLRSNVNSSDLSESWEVVREVVTELKRMNQIDLSCRIALLQPTSPLRTSNDIIQAFNLLNQKKTGMVISGYMERTNHLNLFYSATEQSISKLDFQRAEDGDYLFVVNGAIYMINMSDLKDLNSIPKYPFLMDKKVSVDIDEEMDFKICEMIFDGKL